MAVRLLKTRSHVDVIITYGATCLTKKQQKVSNLRFLKHQVLPKMHQQLSIRSDQRPPYKTHKPGVIYEDAESRTEDRV